MTLYDELRPARRRQLHRAVGNAMEVSRRADLDPCCRNWRVTSWPPAISTGRIDYATRAGQRADALLAFEDAVQFFQTALDAMEQRAEPDDAGALPVAAPAGRGAAQVECLSASAGDAARCR